MGWLRGQPSLRSPRPCRLSGNPNICRALQAAQAAATVAAEYAQSLQRGAPEAPPVVLRKLFERLGSTYIKLGQFIASRYPYVLTSCGGANAAPVLSHLCLLFGRAQQRVRRLEDACDA